MSGDGSDVKGRLGDGFNTGMDTEGEIEDDT